jgi:hypothetical protein
MSEIEADRGIAVPSSVTTDTRERAIATLRQPGLNMLCTSKSLRIYVL